MGGGRGVDGEGGVRRGSLGLSGPHYPTAPPNSTGPSLWRCALSTQVGGVLRWVQSRQRGGRPHSRGHVRRCARRGARDGVTAANHAAVRVNAAPSISGAAISWPLEGNNGRTRTRSTCCSVRNTLDLLPEKRLLDLLQKAENKREGGEMQFALCRARQAPTQLTRTGPNGRDACR